MKEPKVNVLPAFWVKVPPVFKVMVPPTEWLEPLLSVRLPGPALAMVSLSVMFSAWPLPSVKLELNGAPGPGARVESKVMLELVRLSVPAVQLKRVELPL